MITTSQHGRAASAESDQGGDLGRRDPLKAKLIALLSTSLLSCVGTMKMEDGSSAKEWQLRMPSLNKALDSPLSGEAVHAVDDGAAELEGPPAQDGATENMSNNSVRNTAAWAPQYYLDKDARTVFVTPARSVTTLSVDFRTVLKDFRPLSVAPIGESVALVFGNSEESEVLRIYRLSISADEEPKVKLKSVYSGDSRATPTAAVSLSDGLTLFIDPAESKLYEFSLDGQALRVVADYSNFTAADLVSHISIYTNRDSPDTSDIWLSSTRVSPGIDVSELIILSVQTDDYHVAYPPNSRVNVFNQ